MRCLTYSSCFTLHVVLFEMLDLLEVPGLHEMLGLLKVLYLLAMLSLLKVLDFFCLRCLTYSRYLS